MAYEINHNYIMFHIHDACLDYIPSLKKNWIHKSFIRGLTFLILLGHPKTETYLQYYVR